MDSVTKCNKIRYKTEYWYLVGTATFDENSQNIISGLNAPDIKLITDKIDKGLNFLPEAWRWQRIEDNIHREWILKGHSPFVKYDVVIICEHPFSRDVSWTSPQPYSRGKLVSPIFGAPTNFLDGGGRGGGLGPTRRPRSPTPENDLVLGRRMDR